VVSFFTERPSLILVCAFGVAQLVATLISVYANWGFTNIRGCGWHWAGVVWVWNIIWFFPLDLIKFSLRAYFDPKQKAAIEELLSSQPSTEAQKTRRKSTIAGGGVGTGPPSRRRSTVGSGGDGTRSRRSTLAETASKYYAPHTQNLSTSHHHRNFARMLKIGGADAPRVVVDNDELRRFSLVQAHHAAKLLNAPGGDSSHRTTAV